ncbi:Uu.00g035850.m01.CDS01 [Anthostomella pinea]|uniref:Uu.00g035850.m01.CDS01 n=1 Tax=Anthostomella pinea TaxID=933095 RepID=A0AAI8YDH7_9PEZI|nr:Uu.00g035850.m01.CDS01 [Anthostomella pinea]
MVRKIDPGEVFIDDGETASDVAFCAKGGIDKGGEWDMERFSPFVDLSNRARLCSYGGGPDESKAWPVNELIRDIEEGSVKIPVKASRLEEIHKVHYNPEP